ncbi:uncharacterized protein BP5553_09104 [Venustampulla echinocandica]|uniref:Uncharacterized protein n=1 Tax=Venustampulla echinocandica TaxID=2656787 RepID=A0A370TDV4_9HELO|nr:uncharacterized protein BP5553_09104 [Venustampulla echinocandica]RDL32648.1 hypothetical protein BP5553_09104 [Venustampulla echinocandica]
MATNSSLSLQWSLDNTSLNALSIGRGIVQAMTGDNIQPIALLACEKFGTTLPVCIETSLKIEQLARRSHSSTANFLKAQIGYSVGDAAYYLSQSDGGIRFLCLAATLCTIKKGLVRAQLLDELLRSTVQSCEMFPTLMQLNDLLRALETKMTVSSFANEVIGWALMNEFSIYHGDVLERENSGVVGGLGREEVVIPANPDIQRLVAALRDCFRIGPECNIHILSSRRFAAWTIAFVKWFTGSPPCLNFGAFASVESMSRVSLFLLPQRDSFEISVVKQVADFNSLLCPENKGDFDAGKDGSKCGSRFCGLIDVPTLFSLKLQRQYGTCGPGQKVLTLLVEAVFMILKHLPETIIPMPFYEGLGNLSDANLSVPRPFPPFERRMEIAQVALGNSLEVQGTAPNLEKWKEHLQQHRAQCCKCKKSFDERSSCIARAAGVLAADLLATCLYDIDDIASLKVPLRGKYSLAKKPHDQSKEFYIESSTGISACWPELVVDGWQSLVLNGEVTWLSISPFEIVSYAVGFLGLEWDHGDDSGCGGSIISLGRGQVVYPDIFNKKHLTQENYLSLQYTRGTVQWDGMGISKVISSGDIGSWVVTPREAFDHLNMTYYPSVSKDASMTWNVEVGEKNGLLLKGLLVDLISFPRSMPWFIFMDVYNVQWKLA